MSEAIPVFAFQNVSVTRRKNGQPILAGIDLCLGKEERIGILGKNGSGKSTLLHAGAGLLVPDAGEVLYDGCACLTEEDFVQARKKLGYLLQQAEDQLFCSTILEDVAFGPYNLGYSAAESEDKAKNMLQELGLENFADRNGQTLSGGEQKLAALASILVMDVSLLFLDEPTSNLDEPARELLLRQLEQRRLPALIVSHDVSFLLSSCTSFRLLEGGILKELPRHILTDCIGQYTGAPGGGAEGTF